MGSPSQEQWRAGVFTAADFPRPAPGTVGNLPRNAYRGPGYLNTDLSLVKRLALPAIGRTPACSSALKRTTCSTRSI